MTGYEELYLGMVIIGFIGFAATLMTQQLRAANK